MHNWKAVHWFRTQSNECEAIAFRIPKNSGQAMNPSTMDAILGVSVVTKNPATQYKVLNDLEISKYFKTHFCVYMQKHFTAHNNRTPASFSVPSPVTVDIGDNFKTFGTINCWR
jgi:hypothetical protein